MELLDKKWDKLKNEEERLFAEERKRKICEGIPSIIFLVIVMLESYFSHFAVLIFSNRSDITKKFIPIPQLWNCLDKINLQDIPSVAFMIPLVGAAAFGIIAGITAALLSRFTKNIKGNAPSLCPKTKSFDSAIIWTKALKKRHIWAPRFFIIALLIVVLWIVGITTIIIYNYKDTIDFSNTLLTGFAEILFYSIVWAILIFYFGVPKYQWVSYFNNIIKELKTEKEKQAKFNNLIQLYIDNKHDEVRELLKDYKNTKSGDICALKIHTAKLETDITEQVRNAYDSLWKAKELGFVNDKIRQDTDEWLAVLTPMIKALAQEDILKAYQQIIDGDTGLILYCDEHAAYGHPDAVVLQIFGYINSGLMNDPERFYESWLEKIKMAKRRGISEELQEMAETLITGLEKQIRINKEYEKWEKQIAAKYTPTYSMDGSLSSWAEFSGWYDFRTGEPLYRVEGHIVNAKGEDVSAAWWE